ncbi:MAG: hypothetical protein JO327_09350 [Nitrososphaeraceae archaeon]|nr:hypothetical protein [Nitrososphaeraceae archaeon]
MVSVDVQDCTSAVTFDSYPKGKDMSGNNIWYSEYSGSIEDDDESSGQKARIM